MSFGPILRTNATGTHGHNQPAYGAHVDYGDRTVRDFTYDLLPQEEADRRLKGRYMLINLWRPLVNPDISPAKEASTAKMVSLVVKFGALLFIVFLPTQYAIDLQLLGGVWILQIFPAIVFTLYTRRLSTVGLLAGWLVGIVIGTGLAIVQGLKPVYPLHLGSTTWPLYIGLIALVANIVVTFIVSAISPKRAAVGAVARG